MATRTFKNDDGNANATVGGSCGAPRATLQSAGGGPTRRSAGPRVRPARLCLFRALVVVIGVLSPSLSCSLPYLSNVLSIHQIDLIYIAVYIYTHISTCILGVDRYVYIYIYTHTNTHVCTHLCNSSHMTYASISASRKSISLFDCRSVSARL